MKVRLFERRNIWWPTWRGWLVLLFLVSMVAGVAFRNAEDFLSPTKRVPAEVLVVEGWIGQEALQAAVAEFRQGGYHWLVSVGGWPARSPSTTAQLAAVDLARFGCPTNALLIGSPSDRPEDRTYECARSARDVLTAHGIKPAGLMVFTERSHGRRSRLVFQKVFGDALRVGVISYESGRNRQQPWWRSTVRSKSVIEECLGWLMERLGFECRE